jgi:leader peptidase (prepilin peptidase)/N-methyltransferase
LNSTFDEGHLDPALASASFALGLAFGSFLNVCIYRLPRDLSVVHPRSACPRCRQPIAFYDNIPVLSWLLLRGRCRACKAAISPRYLIIELLTAGLFLACYAQFGFSLATLKYWTFGFLLLGLIFTDAETQLLPDKMTLTGLAAGLGFSLLVPVNDLASQLLPGVISLPIDSTLSWHLLSLTDAILGAVVGASFIYGAGAIYFRARGVEGMGFGDVKLMAMVGAFLGLKLTVLTIFAGSVAGSIFGLSTVFVVWIKRTRRRIARLHEPAREARQRAWESARIALRRHQMPFGVFLGGVALLALFFGDSILRWYWGLL